MPGCEASAVRQGPAQVRQGGVVAIFAVVEQAASERGFGQAWIKSEGSVEVVERPIQPAQFDERQAAVVITPATARRQRDAGRERGQGFVVAAQHVSAAATVIIGPEIVRPNPQSLFEMDRRPREVALRQQVAAECGMSVAEVYVAKNRAIKKLREIVALLTQEFDDE